MVPTPKKASRGSEVSPSKNVHCTWKQDAMCDYAGWKAGGHGHCQKERAGLLQGHEAILRSEKRGHWLPVYQAEQPSDRGDQASAPRHTAAYLRGHHIPGKGVRVLGRPWGSFKRQHDPPRATALSDLWRSFRKGGICLLFADSNPAWTCLGGTSLLHIVRHASMPLLHGEGVVSE